LGGNIIPFDFIQTDEAQKQIIEFHLLRMEKEFAQIHQASSFKLTHDAGVVERLAQVYCPDIERGGGRGIVNSLERAFSGELAERVRGAERKKLGGVTFVIKATESEREPFWVEAIG